MTHEEIDKWVEDHIVGGDTLPPEWQILKTEHIRWTKMIAHKFYELGCKAGAEAFKQSLNMY